MNAALGVTEICQVIRDYVREDIYQYAIMLDGEWGCGKSWFIKNKVKPMFDEGRECCSHKYIYVSLYGVASVDALSKAVTGAYFSAVAPTEEKVMNVLISLGTPLTEEVVPRVGKTAAELMGKLIAACKNQMVDLKSCFFVFDDLERCCMPVTEVLGYINRLIETEECKVLIVANEQECGKSGENGGELQLIAAKMLEEHIPQVKTDNDRMRRSEAAPARKLNRLKDFSRKLFRQDALYLKTKEKLIGRTLRYEPDMKAVVSALANKALADIPYDFRCALRERCIKTMQDEGVGNLRILQFALSCYAEIHPLIAGMDMAEPVKKRVAEDVINSVLRVSIRSKTNGKDRWWDVEWKKPDLPYDYIYCSEEHEGWNGYDYVKNGFQSFRFVHYFILDGKLDVDCAKMDLAQYADSIATDMRSRTGAFAVLDSGYWNLTEEKLRECVDEVRRIFLENGYTPLICLKILRNLVFYEKEMGIEYCACEDLKTHLLNQVEAGVLCYDLDRDGMLRSEFFGEKVNEDLKAYIRKIEEAQNAADKRAYRSGVDTYQDPEWSTKLLKRVIEDSGTVKFSRQKGFVRYLNIDNLVNALIQGTGVNYSNLIDALRYAYRFGVEDFVDDAEPLAQLIERLRTTDIADRLVARARDMFCKHADDWINKMKDVLETDSTDVEMNEEE